MTTLDDIPKTYEDAVARLATWHSSNRETPISIYAFSDPDKRIIRLLEVSDDFPSTAPETTHLQPVPFGRSHDFPFASGIIQISEADWSRVESDELALPAGWDLLSRREINPGG